MARHHKRAKEKSFSLNMVSLMDIFTILVFFLLVTSSENQVVSQPKNILLPESTASKSPKQNTVIIVNNNKIELLGESLPIEIKNIDNKRITRFIRSKLTSRGIHKKDKSQRSITIMGDKSIPYSVLKTVMLSVAATNIQNISFAVLKKSEG
jgi:biopolymer transport protein ExbD